MARLPGETVTGTWMTDTGATISGLHYTVKGLAELLGTTAENVHYHIRKGHVPTHKVGQARLIPAADARRIARGYTRNRDWPTTSKDSPHAPRSRPTP
ncbi:MAG TPA: helix-turn-helix domain-containing protein [Pseudonocardiaceae bacterium]|jgi:excisionase family DNA binding protein|nr:helix-turn-helix domain-containing protein [Pseudonocardiaceae bacterium]